MKIETFLPVFPGFYETIFAADEEDFLRENDITYEQIEVDYKQYRIDCAKSACDTIETNLSDFVTGVKFQTISSPRFYNFKNDSIYCEIEVRRKDIKAIKNYIYSNISEFRQYLKDNYTPQSGFIPYYSNDFEDWCEYTQSFTDYRDKEHCLGSVLEFICKMEEIDSDTLYEGVREDGIYTENYCSIKETKKI